MKYLIILTLSFLSLLCGCSHSREFARRTLDDGTKEPWVTVQETAIGILSPSVKRVYEFNKVTGERRPIAGTVATGNGATGNALQGVGTFFGLREIGDGLSDSGDKNTFSGGNARANQSQDQGQEQGQTQGQEQELIGPPLPPRSPKWPPGHNKPKWK